MNHRAHSRRAGFTLIELMAALLILSLLALMAYRSLAAVLEARDQVIGETEKWRHVSALFARFERDVHLAAPRQVRSAAGFAPAWIGRQVEVAGPRLEFSRFASSESADAPRRVAYALNEKHEIELLLWPSLDMPASVRPTRYPVLTRVRSFELTYLDSSRTWVLAWPRSAADPAIPRAVRLHIVLSSGEDLVRVFALNS